MNRHQPSSDLFRASKRLVPLGKLLLVLLMSLGSLSSTSAADETKPLRWTKFPSLPDREGFAYMFTGVHQGVLLAAGGANFPDKRPWEGGTKIWYDTIYALEKPDAAWKPIGKLPRPLGYGVSLTTPEGVICLGGSDAKGHRAEVFRLSLDQGKVKFTDLPALPRPCANMSGAMIGSIVYITGGIDSPAATKALNTFWALDLKNLKAGWRELEPWPGPARMLATTGALDGSLYLFSGTALKADVEGKPAREWLRDAYRYTLGKGWKRLADLPHVSVAAPTPAPALANNQLLVLGGDDGAQINVSPADHKGFPRDILAYDTKADKWTVAGHLPFSQVTVPVTEWHDQFIIVSGEQKPGIRSPEVWGLKK